MKKKTKIIIAIVVVAIIAIAFIGGQTYAKYMSKVTGKGTATIASWSFKANDNENVMQNINLKSTLNNEKIKNYEIAPGTNGSFQIKLDATGSEVGINYRITFENETTKPANLKYIYEGHTYRTLADLQKALIGTLDVTNENKVKALVINWEWPYETKDNSKTVAENDKIDTQNAKDLSNYSFDIIVSGTQVDPR